MFNMFNKKMFVPPKTLPFSKLLTIISSINYGYSPVIHTIVFRKSEVLRKVFLIKFLGFTQLIKYSYTNCTLTVLKSIVKVSYIGS